MIEHHAKLATVCGWVLAGCLVILAGCGGDQSSTGNQSSTMAAPAAVTAIAGSAQVSLTWSADTGATSYDVKRATISGGPYTQVASVTSPSYTDSTVTNGVTYYYVITAVGAGDQSADSAQITATPDPTVVTPAVPTGFSATAGNAQVSLTWSASSGATGYHVKRATTSGGPYTQLAAPSSPSYTDTSVSNGTTYFYVVSAMNSAGESANSAQVSASPLAPASIPAVPAGLAAVGGNAQVSLTWSASSGATGYHVKRATTSGGPYTQIGAPTSAAYSDATVTNGTKYYYVVSALDSAGESANSMQVSAAPMAPVGTSVPSPPAGLAAVGGNAQVSLTWSASNGATGYHVKRATTNGGPYTQIAAPTSSSYTDTSVSNGTTYYYVVSALDSAGESANSAQVSAAPSGASIPAVPAGLAAVGGNAQVSLTWSASSGATGYHVKRATTSGGPYTQIAAPTSSSYTDTSVTEGTTYYYVVSAFDSAGESANSVQVNAVPNAANPPPATLGTWINVTPSNVDLTDSLCGNYGTETVQVDPAHPSNLYVEFNCQGIWKSTDYGATWSGPINTGTNGATVSSCGSGITVSPISTGTVPTIYEGCIRGNAIGFWKSVDGGVNWTHYSVGASTNRQDYFPPVVDPYDANHLLLPGHEFNSLVESVDGGQTWTNVSLESGMLQNGGTGFIYFINTGTAATTRGTWLWIGQQAGGAIGTWRTENSGESWVQVDRNEHSGSVQIYQPDDNGVVYMPGTDSALGAGVLKSDDYGQTWTHVGKTNAESVVVGTAKNLYSMHGYPIGLSGSTQTSFEIAAQPGTGSWVGSNTPAALNEGISQIAVVNDGTHNILLGAMFNSGVWRYIEP